VISIIFLIWDFGCSISDLFLSVFIYTCFLKKAGKNRYVLISNFLFFDCFLKELKRAIAVSNVHFEFNWRHHFKNIQSFSQSIIRSFPYTMSWRSVSRRRAITEKGLKLCTPATCLSDGHVVPPRHDRVLKKSEKIAILQITIPYTMSWRSVSRRRAITEKGLKLCTLATYLSDGHVVPPRHDMNKKQEKTGIKKTTFQH
jgi:hypothetical protein